MTRYPLTLRIIHWFTALMFIPMLAGGYFWLRPMASTDPTKLDALMYHMSIGVFLVTLTAVRLILRWRMAHPEATGIALWAHRALYLTVFLMPVSGFTMVFSARLNDIVFRPQRRALARRHGDHHRALLARGHGACPDPADCLAHRGRIQGPHDDQADGLDATPQPVPRPCRAS